MEELLSEYDFELIDLRRDVEITNMDGLLVLEQYLNKLSQDSIRDINIVKEVSDIPTELGSRTIMATTIYDSHHWRW